MIKASEESTVYYTFDDDVLIDYKHWVEERNITISKDTFYEFIVNNYDISDFEIDTAYEGRLSFEEDLEEKIKSLND